MTISEKVQTLAGAIRSRARAMSLEPAKLTDRQINELGDAQYQEQPSTVAAKFYVDCSDRQWKQVVRMVKR